MFYISSNCNCEEGLPDDLSSFFYDYQKSETFKNTSDFTQTMLGSLNAAYAKETFSGIYKFEDQKIDQLSSISLPEFEFVMAMNNDPDKNKINCLEIGIKIINKNNVKKYQNFFFFDQLKKKDYISSYDFCFVFDNFSKKNGKNLYNSEEYLNSSGKLVIGELPHNFDPKNFYKSQLVQIYGDIRDYSFNWEIKFDKVYVQSIQHEILSNYLTINPNLYYIYASKNYQEKILEMFFSSFLEQNLCHEYLLDEDYTIAYYCDKSEKFNE